MRGVVSSCGPVSFVDMLIAIRAIWLRLGNWSRIFRILTRVWSNPREYPGQIGTHTGPQQWVLFYIVYSMVNPLYTISKTCLDCTIMAQYIRRFERGRSTSCEHKKRVKEHPKRPFQAQQFLKAPERDRSLIARASLASEGGSCRRTVHASLFTLILMSLFLLSKHYEKVKPVAMNLTRGSVYTFPLLLASSGYPADYSLDISAWQKAGLSFVLTMGRV